MNHRRIREKGVDYYIHLRIFVFFASTRHKKYGMRFFFTLRILCTVHNTRSIVRSPTCPSFVEKKIAHILIPYFGASSNYCGAYNIARARHRCIKDKKKWEEYIAKAEPLFSHRKLSKIKPENKLKATWLSLRNGEIVRLHSRHDYIWQAKKRFGERAKCDWKYVSVVLTRIDESSIPRIISCPLQDNKKLSDYLKKDEKTPQFLAFTANSYDVPKDKDGVSSESEDDEKMFV